MTTTTDSDRGARAPLTPAICNNVFGELMGSFLP
jgi:hypothetical protein